MKPIITYRLLNDFPAGRRKQLCQCEHTCENVILIVQDEFTYQVCEKSAAEFSFEILQTLGRITKPLMTSRSKWSVEDTLALRDYILGFEGEVPHGALRKFAELKGKSRDQVKSKISYLKRTGMLPYVNPRAGTMGKK